LWGSEKVIQRGVAPCYGGIEWWELSRW
jgi:hypothetical protein